MILVYTFFIVPVFLLLVSMLICLTESKIFFTSKNQVLMSSFTDLSKSVPVLNGLSHAQGIAWDGGGTR